MDIEEKQLLAETLAELRELRAERRRGTPPTGKTLRELFELYEATWAEMAWAPSLRGTLRPALRHFGERVADEITRADWIHWRDNVRAKETTIRKGPPSIYTRNQEFKRWRSVYRWGKTEGHCHTNPLADVRAARGGKKHRETEPTHDDVTAIRRHCDAITWAFIKLGFRRGFRASEARRLEWKQVDVERGRVTLAAHQTKTRKAYVMRIPSDVVEALRAIKPDVGGRYVFPGRDGSPMVATTLWRRVRLAIDASGVEAAEGDRRMTFHDFRHGFTSRAARRNPLQVAMRLSRHTSLSAAQRYIHVNDDDMETAYQRLEEDARKPPHVAQTAISPRTDLSRKSDT